MGSLPDYTIMRCRKCHATLSVKKLLSNKGRCYCGSQGPFDTTVPSFWEKIKLLFLEGVIYYG